jgi:predicted small integral membrane protein
MDTTFPDTAAMSRAITSPRLWTLGHLGIIAGEGLSCLLPPMGALRMWAARGRAAPEFDAAKDVVIAGVTMGFPVWFVGFMVVCGEWLLRWQSGIWDGQQAAFRFYLTMLAVLVFVNQPERS